MTTTMSSTSLRAGLGWMTGLALAAAGCMAQVDADPAVAKPAVASKSLLASLKLSDTHSIEFWEYDGADFSIQEKLDMDRDLKDGHATLARMASDPKGLLDTYMLFAKDAAEPAAITRLREADEWIASQPPVAIDNHTPRDIIGGDALRSAAPTEHPNALPSSAGVAVSAQALACTEPAWDWVGDVGWFKNNFCGSDSKYCATEVWWASYGWYRGPSWFKATGMAESQCAGARWTFKRRSYGGFPFYGIAEDTLIDTNLTPRQLNTQYWTTTGDRAWYCKVTSNTGANRTALAVHHN